MDVGPTFTEMKPLPDVAESIRVRPATVADARTIANHRVGMFRDMRVLDAHLEPELRDLTEAYLREAMPRGEYVGWLASVNDAEEIVVAGAGVQVRRILPRPMGPEHRVAAGREGIVLNVYTEKKWRRHGLAERLMREVLAWAARADLDKLVLHASADGRSLYERLGFEPTNEMRFARELRSSQP